MTAITCAVNTFDQNEVFSSTAYNGLCWNARVYNTPGWGSANAYSVCNIDFGPPAGDGSDGGSQKRAVGEFNGWQVYGIKMLDNKENDVVVPDDHMPGGTLMPADRISKTELPKLPAVDF